MQIERLSPHKELRDIGVLSLITLEGYIEQVYLHNADDDDYRQDNDP